MTSSHYFVARFVQAFGVTRKNQRMADAASEMQVRLAEAKGLLRGSNLNHFQEWALEYWIYLSRRVQFEDQEQERAEQCYTFFPDRWSELYADEPKGMANFDEEFEEIPITDPSDLDSWYESVNKPRTLFGADAPEMAS